MEVESAIVTLSKTILQHYLHMLRYMSVFSPIIILLRYVCHP